MRGLVRERTERESAVREPSPRRVPRVLIVIGGAIGLLLLLVVIGSAVEHVVYSGDVLPGVNVDGVNVAGRQDVKAVDAVARFGVDLTQTDIRVRAGGDHFAFQPTVVAYSVDADATVKRAASAGRKGNPVALVSGTVMRRFRPDHVPLVVHYDPARLEGLLDGWSSQIDKGLVEGDLHFDGTTVNPVEPQPGFGLQRDAARADLVRELEQPNRTGEIALPVGEIEPRVDRAHVDAAATRARALLAVNHEIDLNGTRIVLTPAQLAPTLGTNVVAPDLQVTIDIEKLRFMLAATVGKLEQDPVDATFAVSPANTVSVVPSQDGLEIDLDTVARAILQGQQVVNARFVSVHPAHDTKWARSLGITKFVSTFTTRHSPGEPRVHNIHLAADILNNTIVAPDETFSLNDLLGPRTADKGYVKAPILVEDGFGEDFGGGISQLTTTLYNAVFFGGYEDVEHVSHQFYISRYPMGREATINYPSIDLKFRNDTDHGVLIRTSYSDTSITVSLYGDNDGRTVREENRRILHTDPITDQLVSCPVPKPEEDPTNKCAHLGALQRVSAQPGETGYDVAFDRVIDQPGKPEYRRHYQVHYPMLPNRILIGAAAAATTVPSTAAPSVSAPTTTVGPAPTTRTTLRHR